MPKLISKPPKYRKHKPSGQAVVTLDGHDFYLGPHGTKASHLEYDRLIGEWIQNGLMFRLDTDDVTAFATLSIHHTTNRQIIAFGGPTGEYDLGGLSVEKLCHLATRRLDRPARLDPVSM